MTAIIREEPEPVGKLRPDLPLPVQWIVERCLAKDKEERYASTKDLARDLSSVRDRISEVSSGAEAMLAAMARPRRRLRLLAIVAVTLAIGLVVGWALTRGGTPRASAPSFQRLTFRSGIIGNARFAPDGRTVVYGAIWDGSGTDMSVYLTRPESPESRRFEVRNADILAISASGEIAILEYATEGTSTGTLALVPMTGGLPRQVLDEVFYSSADFEPGGKDLAVVHRVQDQIRLEFPIGKLLLQGSVGSPRFSPDGSEIAFWEYQGNPRYGQAAASVDLIDREGGSKKVLSEGWQEWAGTPCWAADGKEIWFTAKKQGQRIALWAVDRSGHLRLVSRLPGALELDDVGGEGRLLLAHHTILHSVRARGPGTSDERELSWLDNSVPSGLSRDGRAVLLTETGEGAGHSPAVYLRGVDGSPAVRLGDGIGLALSPDQKWVLVAAGPHLETLVLLPTGAGSPVRLETEGLHEFDGGAFTPDGKRIVFSAGASKGKHRVYALDIASGKPRAISPEDVTLRRFSDPVSPDGKWVVGLERGAPVFCRVEGGNLRPLAGWPEGETFVGWSADGRSLYAYRWSATSIQVDVVDRESGRTGSLREIATPITLRKVFLIAPDGNAYVYGGRRTISELYLVEGLH
jgi:Tol biopolymer transport system component